MFRSLRRTRPRRTLGALTASAAVAALLVPLPAAPAAAQLDIEPGEMLAFDFGCEDGPVADGHIEVTPTTVYDADAGYGLSHEVDCRDRGAAPNDDAMLQDFVISWDYEFYVDLADGDYFVTIFSGDEEASNNTSAVINGEDTGSLQPRGTGEYAEYTTEVTVDDGRLTVTLQDDGRINGLHISQVEAPTGLTAEVSTDPAAVELTWDEMPGAAEYTVYRSPAGEESYTQIGITSTETYTDDDVDLGYSYDYVITQTSQAGATSGYSEAVSVAVADPDIDPPATPEDLAVESADASAVTITWTGSDAADEYHIYRALNPEGRFERLAVTEDTSYTAEGPSEYPWYYTVIAVNAGGISAESDPLVTPRTADPIPDGEVSAQCGAEPGDAEVEQDGYLWRATNGGDVVYEDYSMHEAMQAAVDSLTADRSQTERVVVRGSGVVPASVAVELTDHTSFETCGTIHVAGDEAPFSYEEHIGAVAIRHAENVEVPFLNVTGNPNFGVYLRTSSDVHFGHIDLRLESGLGMRIDSRDDDSVREARNISIDDVYVSGTEAHGVETYGVDGLTIGTVTAVDTGYSGVLLNDTVNAEIGSVIGEGAAAGTGYATFRTANRNGMIDGEYPTNIRVGEVIADGGGRGIFCVSESGGVEIDHVEIRDTGGDAMLLENCHNYTISGGEVEGPGHIVISARDEFDNNTDFTLEDLTVRDSGIREAVCMDSLVLRNLTIENSELDLCDGTELIVDDDESPSPSPTDTESPSPSPTDTGEPTDPASPTEDPTGDPTDEAEAGDDDLATTGFTRASVLLGLGGLLVLGLGVFIVAMNRRLTHTQD
ncbi:hypothetical protein [Nesterenkonia alba]|uniref:hypothetical protein n=1 Tax=Nesterenkonia alba TaxID=515814 RepID=UPI0003B2F438|nr:hypothetical protein [Nesterenkonia alba]